MNSCTPLINSVVGTLGLDLKYQHRHGTGCFRPGSLDDPTFVDSIVGQLLILILVGLRSKFVSGHCLCYIASCSRSILGCPWYPTSGHMINGTISPNPPYRCLIGFGTAIGQISVRWATTRSYGTYRWSLQCGPWYLPARKDSVLLRLDHHMWIFHHC
jgi:hypothetical protein